MGRVFVVELEGRAYECKFCKTHLALADDLVSRGEYHSWCSRGEDDDFRNAYCGRYILLLLWTNCWLEICTLSLSLNIIPGFYASASVIKIISISHCPQPSIFTTQEMAHDKTQKYKEGKFVLERGRIIDGVDSEFYIDTRANMSDAEDA